MSSHRRKDPTLLTHAGRPDRGQPAQVNVAVHRASTVVFPDLDSFRERHRPGGDRKFAYGRSGTPGHFALEETVTALEQGSLSRLTSSGLSAITTTVLGLVRSGDHVLVADSVYRPVRYFCDGLLARMGVAAEYYDPRIGADIARLCRDNTRVIYMESPGSLTFEVQDLPAISAVARDRGIATVVDNTWATGLFCKPLTLGADIVIQAGTKYLGGHSDVMIGVITASEAYGGTIVDAFRSLGQNTSADDAYLALRGLRTLAARLEQHQVKALELARWLEGRPEVHRVIHPALASHPDHALFRRDFNGSSGLFSIVLKPCGDAALAAMIEELELFGLGASWGGFESLVLPDDPTPVRTATRWNGPGPLLRIHVGLEDTGDLIADLERGLERLADR